MQRIKWRLVQPLRAAMTTLSNLPPAAEILSSLREAPTQEDHEFSAIFRQRGAVDPDRGWQLLEALFGFHFLADNASDPFGPMMVMGGKRSMIPGDLTEDQLSALAATMDSVGDPEYRARVADVLWLRRRDPAAARVAVNAYLESGSRLEDPEHWVASMERYQRAARLARQVEPKGDLPKKVLSHVERRVLHYAGSDPLFFTLKALELLAEFRSGDFCRLAEIAGRVANAARTSGNFDRARSYYSAQARLLKFAKDDNGAETARVEAAECFLLEAEAREQGNSSIAAHHFWQKAMNAFRERPSLRGRLPELQRRLAAAGEKALGEMKPYKVEINLREPMEAATKAMAGLPFEDAFFAFATLVPLIDPAQLRQEAIDYIATHPLQSVLEANVFDAAGRKIGARPSAVTTDPSQYEAAVSGFMEELARLHRGPHVLGYIAPAMRQLLAEHEIDESTADALVGSSPLIQADRKRLFIQGLLAGFRWDFPTALHLLIPQIENGLRQMLNEHGIVARNMSPDGIEEVWSYERILAHDVTLKVLGASLVYELQSLLVARLGSNFRNLVAHGLVSVDALTSETAFYLWWLLLRLIALPTPGMAAFIERRKR